MKKNFEIRKKMKELGVYQWQVAIEIGIAECTFLVWLRQELTGERRERVLAALDRIEKCGETL